MYGEKAFLLYGGVSNGGALQIVGENDGLAGERGFKPSRHTAQRLIADCGRTYTSSTAPDVVDNAKCEAG